MPPNESINHLRTTARSSPSLHVPPDVFYFLILPSAF